MRITVEVRACKCRIGEPSASRESAKYDRRHSEGYILAYLANLLFPDFDPCANTIAGQSVMYAIKRRIWEVR